MPVQRQKLNMSVQIYRASQSVIRVPNCAGFMFTNTGDTIVTVNGMVAYPGTPGTILGDSRSVTMQEGEEYSGLIQVAFAIPLGAAPAVEIVQLYYVD